MGYNTIYDTISSQKRNLSSRERELERQQRLVRRGLASKDSGVSSAGPVRRRRGRGELVERKQVVGKGLQSVKQAKEGLAKQRKQVQEYEGEGYKVRKSDDGYEFYKKQKVRTVTKKTSRPLTKSEFREQVDLPEDLKGKISEEKYEDALWDVSKGKSEVVSGGYKFKKTGDGGISYSPGQEVRFYKEVEQKYKVENPAYQKIKQKLQKQLSILDQLQSDGLQLSEYPAFVQAAQKFSKLKLWLKITPKKITKTRTVRKPFTKTVYSQKGFQDIVQKEAVKVKNPEWEKLNPLMKKQFESMNPRFKKIVSSYTSAVEKITGKDLPDPFMSKSYPAVVSVRNVVTGKKSFDLRSSIEEQVSTDSISAGLGKSSRFLFRSMTQLNPQQQTKIEEDYEQILYEWRTGQSPFSKVQDVEQNIGKRISSQYNRLPAVTTPGNMFSKEVYLRQYASFEGDKTFQDLKDEGWGLGYSKQKVTSAKLPGVHQKPLLVYGLKPEFYYKKSQVYYGGETVKPGEIKKYKGGIDFLEGLPQGKKDVLLSNYMSSSEWKKWEKKNQDVIKEVGTSITEKELLGEPETVVPGWLNPFGGDVKVELDMTGMIIPDTEAAKKRLARKQIFGGNLSKQDISKQVLFESMPYRQKLVRTTGENFMVGLSYPVVLTQTAEKYIKGKGDWTDFGGRVSSGKTFLPDIGKTISEARVTKQQGIISGTIGEVVSGGKSDFFETTKDPWMLASASAGEWLGMKTANVAIKSGYNKIKPYTPKILPRVSQRVLPMSRRLRLSQSWKGFKTNYASGMQRVPGYGSFKNIASGFRTEQFAFKAAKQTARGSGWFKYGSDIVTRPLSKIGYSATAAKRAITDVSSYTRGQFGENYNYYRFGPSKNIKQIAGRPYLNRSAMSSLEQVKGRGVRYNPLEYKPRPLSRYESFVQNRTYTFKTLQNKDFTVNKSAKMLVDRKIVLQADKAPFIKNIYRSPGTDYTPSYKTLEIKPYLNNLKTSGKTSVSKLEPPSEFKQLKGDMWIKVTKVRSKYPFKAKDKVVKNSSSPNFYKPKTSTTILKSVSKPKTWVNTKPFIRPSWKGVYDVPLQSVIPRTSTKFASSASILLKQPTTTVGGMLGSSLAQTQRNMYNKKTKKTLVPISVGKRLSANISNLKTGNMLSSSLAQFPVVDTVSIQSNMQGSDSMSLTMQMQKQAQTLVQIPKLKLKTKTVFRQQSFPSTPDIKYQPDSFIKINKGFKPFTLPFNPDVTRRRKKKQKEYDSFKDVFKFRKGKLWSPFKKGGFF